MTRAQLERIAAGLGLLLGMAATLTFYAAVDFIANRWNPFL